MFILHAVVIGGGGAGLPPIFQKQERRVSELESALSEAQQQLEAAQSNRTVTQEALDQVGWPFRGGGVKGLRENPSTLKT